ncbi:hypothetical protein [Paracoccus sp. S-4012]|uniref:hypothetical protein n=1 Tax=Paracoccus sp. S-4012 TaxID=2665648 RepID=UPI0018A1F789|nr:hypothetical protein [Paracoccus sp. S-4012]
MKTLATLMFCGSVLALAACGPNAATRAVTGATTGAVVAGPVGAAAGGLAGATGAVQVR